MNKQRKRRDMSQNRVANNQEKSKELLNVYKHTSHNNQDFLNVPSQNHHPEPESSRNEGGFFSFFKDLFGGEEPQSTKTTK